MPVQPFPAMISANVPDLSDADKDSTVINNQYELAKSAGFIRHTVSSKQDLLCAE